MKYEIINKNNRFYFLVDEKPCLLLGGEVHNSAASTALSMEKKYLAICEQYWIEHPACTCLLGKH